MRNGESDRPPPEPAPSGTHLVAGEERVAQWLARIRWVTVMPGEHLFEAEADGTPDTTEAASGCQLAPDAGGPRALDRATRQSVTSEKDLPVFLLPTDVAAILRTTVKAVYARVERGLLPGVIRDGTRILFDRDALLRGLRGRSR